MRRVGLRGRNAARSRSFCIGLVRSRGRRLWLPNLLHLLEKFSPVLSLLRWRFVLLSRSELIVRIALCVCALSQHGGRVSRFTKSLGLTASERYLAELCERSFLSLWSYPNVYRQPGKELCDNLVVFREHIVIFSDKSCQFPDTGNPSTDWQRWFKRAVQKSAEQVYGAERWLREQPGRLFIDAKCTQPFPLTLPRVQDARFHRVVVALNASNRCKQFFDNSGTGSLLLRPNIIGDAHYSNPFTIGQIDAGRGYVHVFDDVTLNIVLRELDTITDFTDYLTCKEALVLSGRLLGAAGEEELLARYLTQLNKEGSHAIIIPENVDGAFFAEGFWTSVAANPQYAAKKKADRQSYAWDELIEKISDHIAVGTLATGNERPLADHERGIRVMAGESRFARRSLVHALFDLLATAPDGRDATRLVLTRQAPERAYQFLISPERTGQSYETYRERRTTILAAYCHVAKVKRPELLDIIGLATEPLHVEQRSEDLVYIDARNWTEEDEAQTRELQARTGILVSPAETPFHDDEYPEAPPKVAAGHEPKLHGNRKERRAMRAKMRRANKNSGSRDS
jgi:hypothetical protein